MLPHHNMLFAYVALIETKNFLYYFYLLVDWQIIPIRSFQRITLILSLFNPSIRSNSSDPSILITHLCVFSLISPKMRTWSGFFSVMFNMLFKECVLFLYEFWRITSIWANPRCDRIWTKLHLNTWFCFCPKYCTYENAYTILIFEICSSKY